MATRNDLVRAIMSGNVRKVKKVLSKLRKFDVKFSGLLITLAVSRKESKIAQLLIQHFASLKQQKRSYSFTTPLLYASYLGDLEVVKSLVKNGANLNGQSRNGCSALHFAALSERINVLKYLTRHGARADLKGRGKDNRGFTPLHYTCIYNKVKCASILVKYNSEVVNPKGIDDIHPIQLSVSYYNWEVTSLLLNYASNINLTFSESIYETRRDPFDQIFGLPNEEPTLLHWAVIKRDLPIIDLLVNRGANVNIKTKSGITPLMIAAQVNELEPLQMILNRRPSVNDVDSFGNTALHYVYNVREAHQSRYFFLTSPDPQHDKEKIEILINNGANIFAQCSFKFNPNFISILDLAIYFGRTLAVRFLLYMTPLGFRNLDYSLIEFAAFDLKAIDEDIRNDYTIKESLQVDALLLQSFLAAFIENRHKIGFYATENTLQNIKAFVSKIQRDNADFYYCEDKRYMLESENFLKSLQMGPSGITCWDFIVQDREKLVKLAFNQDFLVGFDFYNFYREKCTFYYSKWFSYKVNYALAKSETLGKSIEIISNLFQQVIPFDCCEYIAYCFSNKELKQLVVKFQPPNFRYRNF
ncbi:putative ankyrin repeat protein RF_0381 [Cotesia glomerata]|uniref:putative ankyrin repeat protein RF_0381 n=1 Tax=Cotesia glomerata TaxID=32391 RepID=UPI001D01452B|nr:putative ankyrin repeat protein RF_0381 [Cotesia glomerata]